MTIPTLPSSSSYKLGSIITLGLALAAQSSFAATDTWVGNTSTGWNTPANWSTSAIPTNGDTLVFGAPGTSGLAIVDDIATLTLGGSGTDGIVIGPAAASYTISKTGTTLTLGSSGAGIGIKDSSLFLQTISSALVYGSAQTVQVGGTTGAALSSMTLSGAQSGGLRLTKTGTGLLNLTSGSNALGGLTINAGIVNITSDLNISTAVTAASTSVILNGGTLRTNLNGAFAINANRSILLGDATTGSGGTIATVLTNAGGVGSSTLTYNGVIANNGGTNYLAKTGTQILALGGTNTYTGETRIMQGQLSLDFTQATAPTSNIINSSSKLVMGDLVGDIPSAAGSTVTNSPILFVQGSNTTTTTQTFNGTAIHPGNANVVARGGTSTFNTTVELGALTHTIGGVVGFSLLSNGSTGQGVIAATGTSNTNGIIGGWATTAATVGTTGAVALTQTDWATVNGSNNIVAYTGYTVPTGATPTLTSNAASNIRIDGTSTGNLLQNAGTTDLNTIQVTDTAARTITVGTGNILRLGSFGGVWKTTTGTLTIGAVGNVGTLTAGGAANTAGEIVFNNATGSGATTVNSVIADNGTGAVSIIKTGSVGLTLAGNNSFSGGTYVLQGTLSATNANSFGGSGRSVTVLPGGAVSLSNLTYANDFNLAGSALTLGGTFSGGVTTTAGATVSGTVTLQGDTVIGSSGTSGTITGKITGDYNLSVIGGIIISNTNNDYSGNFGINGLLGPLGGNPVLVKLGADNVLANGSGKGNVVISGSSTAGNYSTLDLNGKTETINGLVSAGTVAQARITNTNMTASTLTLGDNDQSATYNGTILDGTGTVAITKIGAGIQTFGGANTYTGNTTISTGTLALSSTGSISSSAIIAVASGAKFDVSAVSGYAVGTGQTLRGAGLVTGAVTAGSGATVAGGVDASTIGTLTFSSTLNVTAATVSLKLNSTTGTFDSLVSNGLTLGNATLSLTDIGSGTWNGTSTFVLLNNTSGGSVTGTFFGLAEGATVTVGSNNFTISYIGGTGSNDITLTVSAVPEPTTYSALFGALALFGTVFCRRRSKKSE